MKANLVFSLAFGGSVSRFLFKFHPLVLDLSPGNEYYFDVADQLFYMNENEHWHEDSSDVSRNVDLPSPCNEYSYQTRSKLFRLLS